MEKLENSVVQLEPLAIQHIEGIMEAAADKRIWQHLSVELLSKEAVERYVESLIRKREAKTEFPFVIKEKQTDKIVGMTLYMDISLEHRRLEIGSTWLHPSRWRTNINSNCKYLLLQYAFEQLNMQRVQIKTGHENVRSQKAIERLGAVKEGVLRNHMIRKEGTVRHTVMYSIIQEEWPNIKTHFESNLIF